MSTFFAKLNICLISLTGTEIVRSVFERTRLSASPKRDFFDR
jgi:hypothetical protein